jgi:NAD(P)-dependent dehydrogenase (short-subunit alcohol dehydrogenase family)
MANRTEWGAAVALAAGAGVLLAARSKVRREREYDFRGKVVLITGGSRGLGLVLAREFAAQGAHIAICARDAEDLREACQELEARGSRCFTSRCDLRNFDQVQQTVRKVIEHYGAIDVLVNNAGTIAVGPIEAMTLDDYREQMDSNYWSAVHTTIAVLPEMQRRRNGRIVNITSIGGKVAVPHLLGYCASKFAMVGFSRGLRTELHKDGIVVTTVCPGLMRTGSPRNADFKGRHRAEYAWFSISDAAPGISIDAERAAKQVIEACRRGDVEIILSAPAKLGATFDALFPEVSGDLLSLAARVMPGLGADGMQRRKGHESESALSPSPLTALGDNAARRNNEFREGEPVRR